MSESIVQVNGYWLEQYLSACFWHIDADDHPLNRLNMLNENSRAFLVERYLRPELESYSEAQKRMLKATLKYAINFFNDSDWQNFTCHVLPDVTPTPADFFADIWGRLFHGEAWHVTTTEGYFRSDEAEPSLHHNRFKFTQF